MRDILKKLDSFNKKTIKLVLVLLMVFSVMLPGTAREVFAEESYISIATDYGWGSPYFEQWPEDDLRILITGSCNSEGICVGGGDSYDGEGEYAKVEALGDEGSSYTITKVEIIGQVPNDPDIYATYEGETCGNVECDSTGKITISDINKNYIEIRSKNLTGYYGNKFTNFTVYYSAESNAEANFEAVIDYLPESGERLTSDIVQNFLRNNNNVTKVIIDEGYEVIDNGAFYGYQGKYIEIPNTVTEICGYAFADTVNLKFLSIPESVVTVNDYIFGEGDRNSVSNDLTIEICSAKTYISGYAFDAFCDEYTKSTIVLPPGTLTEDIGTCEYYCGGCFRYKQPYEYDGYTGTLTFNYNGDRALGSPSYESNYFTQAVNEYRNTVNIIVKPGFTSIVTNPLANLNSLEYLESVELPETIETIGEQTFQGCESLKNITIPQSVTSIGGLAFDSCESLERIVIPKKVTSISDSTFSGCISLSEVTIPDTVTSIEKSAFSGCCSLESITIPASTISIGESAFINCKSLENVTISEGVRLIGNYAFNYCEKLDNVTIPSTVETICDYSFQNCNSLKNLTITNGVKNIGDKSFLDCNKLENIVLPESIESIGNQAFSRCTGLKSVEFKGLVGNGCSGMGSNVFEYTHLNLAFPNLILPANWPTAKRPDSNGLFYGGYFSLTRHTHVFSSYELSTDGKTITAICSAEDCGLPNKSVSITIAAEDKTFSGFRQEAASLSDTSAWVTAGLTEPSIGYYLDSTGEFVAPVKAGSYTAKITVNDKTASANFTIRPKQVDPIIEFLDTVTYDGKAKDPDFDVKVAIDGGFAHLVISEYDYEYSNNINAGTATVTVELKGNYSGSASKNFTINKADQTISAPTASSKTTTTVTLNTLSGKGATKYGYNNTNCAPTTWSDSNVITGLTANTTYYFFAKFEGNNNYNPKTSEGSAITTVDHICSNGVKQNGQAPTCTEDGIKDYYKCEQCEQIYEDVACTIEITDFNEWKTTGNGKIEKLGHDWGYASENTTLTATCNRDASHTATLAIAANNIDYNGVAITYGDATDSTKNIKITGYSNWNSLVGTYPKVQFSNDNGVTWSDNAPSELGDYKVRIYPASESANPTNIITADFSVLFVESNYEAYLVPHILNADGTAADTQRPTTGTYTYYVGGNKNKLRTLPYNGVKIVKEDEVRYYYATLAAAIEAAEAGEVNEYVTDNHLNGAIIDKGETNDTLNPYLEKYTDKVVLLRNVSESIYNKGESGVRDVNNPSNNKYGIRKGIIIDLNNHITTGVIAAGYIPDNQILVVKNGTIIDFDDEASTGNCPGKIIFSDLNTSRDVEIFASEHIFIFLNGNYSIKKYDPAKNIKLFGGNYKIDPQTKGVNLDYNNYHFENKGGTYPFAVVKGPTQYKIKLNINTNDTNVTKDGIAYTGETISDAKYSGQTLPTIRRAGYKLVGWNTKADGTGTNYTSSASGLSKTHNSEITLYAKWAVHVHSFNFTSDGNKLIATCNNADCGLTNNKISLTLNVNNVNYYTGNSVTASYGTGEAGDWKTETGVDAPTITYQYKATADGNYASTTETKNVGYYKASATYGGATANIEFEITRGLLSDLAVSLTDWTYGETAKTPSVTGNSGNGNVTYTYAIKGTNNYSFTVPTNAGNYTVKASVAQTDNYQAKEVTKDFTINKATPTYTTPTGLSSYVGKTLADVTLPEGFSWEDPTTTSVGSAGNNTFFVKFTPTDTDNYNEVDNIAVTLSVSNKQSQTLSFTTDTVTKAYGDTAFTNALSGASTTVTYSSSDPTVATVDNNGQVTILKAGEATITATAAEDATHASASKSYTLTINPKEVGVTFGTTTSFTYNGSEQYPTATLTGVLEADSSNVTLNLTGKGTNAGNYTLIANSLTGDASANYTLPETNPTKEYTINPKSLAEGMLTLSSNTFTFNNTSKAPTVTVTDGSALTLNTDYEVDATTSTTSATNVGSYTIKVNGKGNYTGSLTATWGITKASLSNPSVTLNGWTYGQTANDPQVSNNIEEADVTYSYKVKDADDSTYSETKPENAGTYTVKAVIADSTNYQGATVTSDFTITKASLSNETAVTLTGWTYGENANDPTVPNNTSGGTVTYLYRVKDAADETYTSTKPTNAGDYTVKATIAETDNYEEKEVTTDFTIAKANTKASDFTLTPPSNLVYDGQAKKATVENNKVTKIQVKYYDSNNNLVENPTNVGTYTVKVTASAGTNYKALEEETVLGTFTITAKPLSNPTVTLDHDSVTYTGSAITPAVTVKDGETTLTKDVDYTLSGNTSATNVKADYKITVTLKGNYSGSAEKSWSITKVNSSITSSPTAKTNLVYDGTDQTLLTAGVATGGTLVYSTTQNGTYSDSIPTGKNAGTYSAWYKVVGDSNHNDTTPSKVDVTIAKKSVNAPLANTNTFTYNGQNQTYTLETSDLYTITNNVKKDAGSYTVIVSLKDTANYMWSDSSIANKTYTFTVNQKEAALSWSYISFTYDGASKTPTCVVSNILEGDTVNVEVTGSKIDAGTHTAEASSLKGTSASNYKLPEANTQQFTINPKSINSQMINIEQNFYYNGLEQGPVVKVLDGSKELELNKDYRFIEGSVDKATDAGMYTIKIEGIGNYKNQANKDYFIYKADAEDVNVAIKDSIFTYDGELKEVVPVLTYKGLTLVKNTDYTLEGTSSATDAGEYELKITFSDNFYGEITKSWLITKAETESIKPVGYVGDLTVTVTKEEDAPSISASIPSTILGEIELAEIASGSKDIDIILTLKNKDISKVDTASKEAIETKTGLDSSKLTYLDITLDKVIKTKSGNTVVNTETEAITETNSPIEITIDVPKSIANAPSGYNRTYSIIRSHKNADNTYTVDTLTTTYSNGTLTFKTDKFSDYAVTYVDTLIPVQVRPAYTAPRTDVAGAASLISSNGFIELGALAIGSMIGLISNRKKKEDK